MPRVKKLNLEVKVADTKETLSTEVFLSASGMFYARLNQQIWEAPVRGVFHRGQVEVDRTKLIVKVSCETLNELESKLYEVLRTIAVPDVTTELVIKYAIQSRVTFAVSTDPANREISPHAVTGFTWGDAEEDRRQGGRGSRSMFGNGDPGFRLAVAVRAYRKTTTTYGGSSDTKYEMYYGEGGRSSDLSISAARLNAWNASPPGDDAPEIPYSDEAADFFYDLMYAMAQLSRRVHEFTAEPERLLALIASGQRALPGPKNGETL